MDVPKIIKNKSGRNSASGVSAIIIHEEGGALLRLPFPTNQIILKEIALTTNTKDGFVI
jgi:hypothetical protein